ncbi:hypothetical protein [Infirmifilum sp. NZ]|uniref:hypothetical protein n=1 Tax=Infirmifilum sp. NZ TaxID=2926850 RepID=UPI0027A93D24|nr:hypothetical protein [Infirmifilum sp. NZ]UNQ73522.1 hypothetical protein MOV14_00565 [Infirmifilum sp. NZ]
MSSPPSYLLLESRSRKGSPVATLLDPASSSAAKSPQLPMLVTGIDHTSVIMALASSELYASPSMEESLREAISDVLQKLGAPLLHVEIRDSEELGLYAMVILDCNAREAMQYWLKIAEQVKMLGIPVFVTWTGYNDLKPEEHGAYVGKALALMGVFLKTREPIDVVAALKEAWGS